MKKFFRFIWTYLRISPKILIFELIFKLLISALFVPIISLLAELAMKASGISSIRFGNLDTFLLSPATIGIAILILLILASVTLLEITSLTVSFAYSRERQKIGVFGMLKCGIKSLFKAVKGWGIFSLLGLMLNLSLAQILLYSGLVSAPIIKVGASYIGGFAKPAFYILVILLEILFAWLLSGRVYSLQYLVLTKHNFRECTKRSREVMQHKRLKTAFTLLIWSMTALAFAGAITFLISFLIIFGIKGFSRPEASLRASLKVLNYAGKVVYAVLAIVTVPFITGGLTSNFYDDVPQDEKIILPKPHENKLPKSVKRILLVLAFGVGVVVNFSFIQSAYHGNAPVYFGIFNRTQITAHRGFSHDAPENTMYAFQSAIDADADYIELDVQQTKDGKLVVFHDETMERVVGIPDKISDYSYSELKKISVGQNFTREDCDFSDAAVPLLSDVLELAYENDIMLNIEIKKWGDIIDTARKTAEMIVEYDMENSCYVTSFERSALKEVKKIDDDIKTALISNASAPTAVAQMKYIDAVSLNQYFVTSQIVRSIHASGKHVMVWTVNSRSEMKRMISLGVDNIITDRPDIAGEVVYSYGTGDKVLALLETVFS